MIPWTDNFARPATSIACVASAFLLETLGKGEHSSDCNHEALQLYLSKYKRKTVQRRTISKVHSLKVERSEFLTGDGGALVRARRGRAEFGEEAGEAGEDRGRCATDGRFLDQLQQDILDISVTESDVFHVRIRGDVCRGMRNMVTSWDVRQTSGTEGGRVWEEAEHGQACEGDIERSGGAHFNGFISQSLCLLKSSVSFLQASFVVAETRIRLCGATNPKFAGIAFVCF